MLHLTSVARRQQPAWWRRSAKNRVYPYTKTCSSPKSATNISAPRVIERAQPEAVGDRSLARRMDRLRRQKPVPHCQCHRPYSWFRPQAPAMVSAEQVPYRPGPVCIQPPSMGSSCRLALCGLRQPMTHIVEDCHLTRLQGGLRSLHSADEAAVVWLDKTSKR